MATKDAALKPEDVGLEALRTDYLDYIAPSGARRYMIVTGSNGISTITDITEYEQTGDRWGADEANTYAQHINRLAEISRQIIQQAAETDTANTAKFSTKADKAKPARPGALAALNSNGNLVDSNMLPSELVPMETYLSKMETVALKDLTNVANGIFKAKATEAGVGSGIVDDVTGETYILGVADGALYYEILEEGGGQ